MALDVTGRYRYPPANPAWLALRTEAPLEPDLPIVDAHHHLWDESGNRYLVDEFLADRDAGHRVVATVFVQAHFAYRTDGPLHLRPVGETEMVARLARQAATTRPGWRPCAGIVASADLRGGAELDGALDAHELAADGRLRGVRQSAARDSHFPEGIVLRPAPAGLLADTAFRAGLVRLGRRRLTFDALVYHEQLRELAAAADAAPDTTIVLNHYGCPIGVGHYEGRERERFATWARDVRELARRPNVHVKLGGLGMIITGAMYHREALPPDSLRLAADFRPWIECCVTAFGAERCMFESNFPVDKAMYSYGVLWNAFKRATVAVSDDERRGLFHDNAMRVYRLARP